ncbi:MAG: tetratricopeptide repeat protein, partial [Fuerstiella sp.]
KALVTELRDREDRAEYQLVLEYGQSFISMFAARYGLSKILSGAMHLKSHGTLEQRKSALNDALSIIQPNKLWQYRSVFIAAAHVELGLDNPSGATELLSIVQQHTQDGVDSRDLAAMIASAEGDHDAAYTIWKKVSDMKPTAPLHDRLSRTKAIRGQKIRDVHRGQSALLSGMDAWRRNSIDEARSYLSEAVRLLPADEKALFYMGEVHRLQGDTDSAVSAFIRCLQQNPDHGRAIARMNQIKSD